MRFVPLLALWILLAACVGPGPAGLSPEAVGWGDWRAYDAGVARVWIARSADLTDMLCRQRGADPYQQRTDKLRGCADLCAREIFSIEDPAVLVHEAWHLATGSLTEPENLCPVNAPGTGPALRRGTP